MAKKVAADLPHNGDAERAVLGSALISKDALIDVLGTLEESDFFEGRHQLIYRAIYNLNLKQSAVDVLTVTEELMNMKELENIGGVPYLSQCSDSMVALSSLKFYISIVYDQSVLRSMLLTIRGIDERYRKEEIDNVNSFILDAENAFRNSIERRHVSTFKNAKEIGEMVEEKLKNQKESADEYVTGIDSGFDSINRITQGFQKGELTIIAARPSVGKTALAINIAYKVATQSNKSVAIFSLEMSSESLFKRLMSCASMVPMQLVNSGHLTGKERAELAAGIRDLKKTPIYIDDTPNNKLVDIINSSHKLQAADPNLGLIVIDYLGLIQTASANSKNADSRQEEVRKISLALKALARDLEIPLIVVSQLSRSVEQRDSKRPMLSDLRDSGSIEQDADVVMLLYREDYYDKRTTGAENKKGGQLSDSEKFDMAQEKKKQELAEGMRENKASYVEVNVAKNRNGQTGKANLFFYKSICRFDNPTPEWEAAMAEIAKDNGN